VIAFSADILISVITMLDKFLITQDGYKRLEQELHHLKSVERPSVITAIAEARAHGDLSENAEYSSAKEKQGFIEAKIADLDAKIARAEIINTENIKSDSVLFGAKVVLIDQDTDKQYSYQLVSDYEADLSSGLISIASPLGKALLGKKTSSEVEVETPKGTKYYEILNISYS
jgi:transcription elongation factor GreA